MAMARNVADLFVRGRPGITFRRGVRSFVLACARLAMFSLVCSRQTYRPNIPPDCRLRRGGPTDTIARPGPSLTSAGRLHRQTVGVRPYRGAEWSRKRRPGYAMYRSPTTHAVARRYPTVATLVRDFATVFGSRILPVLKVAPFRHGEDLQGCRALVQSRPDRSFSRRAA